MGEATEISRFYDITITMPAGADGAAPRLVATYNGQSAAFDLDSLAIVSGAISPTAQEDVTEWAELHRQELREAWERVQRNEPPGDIEALDAAELEELRQATLHPDPDRPALVAVEPREGYRIWLRYDDGACGEVDLSHNVGKGVFKAWDDRAFFESAHLDEFGGVAWGEDGELDACGDALYMRLTGTVPKALVPWVGDDAAAALGNA